MLWYEIGVYEVYIFWNQKKINAYTLNKLQHDY